MYINAASVNLVSGGGGLEIISKLKGQFSQICTLKMNTSIGGVQPCSWLGCFYLARYKDVSKILPLPPNN